MKKKYVVDKEFLDRFDDNKHLHPGDPHIPHNDERAQRLIDLGFIHEEKEGKTPVKAESKPAVADKQVKVSDPDESSEAK